MDNYYKITNLDGSPRMGAGCWNLPRNGRPGEWMPAIKNLKPCVRGYHLCRPNDLIHWLGPAIWRAEGRGNSIICDNKVVFEEARLLGRVETWTEHTARTFACDCAERVLPLFESQFPNDSRPRDAIVAARAAEEAVVVEAAWAAWEAAATAAAWEAAWAARAAWEAAWAAAREAWAAWAAGEAAGAAGEAAGEDERAWQTKRLLELILEPTGTHQ